ncbi:SAM-dependent methyltransferase [Amycolatopsis sp. WAC 01376]|uniref:class I SAM-dependent methyltransferase n=1 Tax=Amycolatopsis sp. WAC 01376 TaxID=2203195 RepID=UPI000F78E58C|nr:class I SAM-dependent methyltransferase [Amycolatopsis sp. WAC 01376]RSM57330.1 SAM-dependent methyltransferase [Amycolatopsis sp. WAC 01376]
MSSREVGTRRAFDAAAADFTALGRHLWEPIGAATVAAAGIGEGDRVLDACCGTGASAIPAARAAGAGGVVDAIDLSGPMIGELRRRSADLPQLRAHEADATAWDTGGYDVVQSALGIFFFPDMTDGTERLISRARSGGRAVFTIWRGGSMVAAGRHLGRAVAAVTESAPPPEREPSLIDRVNQADTYTAWLSGRNLSDVDVVVNELRLTMTPEVAWLVVIGSGFRGLLADLEPGAVEQVRERYLDSLRAEGVTELDATTLIGSGTVR